MGIYDRDYNRSDQNYGYRPQVRFAMPRITPAVKWLLIINIAIFIFERLFFRPDPYKMNLLEYWFSVYPAGMLQIVQIWRLVTYQFLHGDFWHLFFNMLWLFFLGPMIEGTWGTKRFLWFYLICGALGGILYPVLLFAGVLNLGYMIGASGAIFGVMAAAAILYPHTKIYIFGILPIPLYILAIVGAVINFFELVNGPNAGGSVAHLAGMAGGVIYVLYRPFFDKLKVKHSIGAWEKKMQNERAFQVEVDRILTKVHNSGLSSLTRKEKKILQEATRREQNSRR